MQNVLQSLVKDLRIHTLQYPYIGTCYQQMIPLIENSQLEGPKCMGVTMALRGVHIER